MTAPAHKPPGPLWAHGELIFRVDGPDAMSDRIVQIDRPFALVGQSPEAEIRVGGPGINGRHLYLHLDPRGVFAVDLVTRTGTRFNGQDQAAGWLRPGDWLEAEGHRIELVQIRIDGQVVDPPLCDDDPLARSPRSLHVPLTLEPRQGQTNPWSIGSELTFLGWSSACGLQVKDSSVAKVHCALLRTRHTAYVINLGGRPTRINGQPVRGATPLDDGDSITVGSTTFRVRLNPNALPIGGLARTETATEAKALVAHVLTPEIDGPGCPFPLDPTASESQNALLTWMADTIQQTQGSLLQQQGILQTTLVEMLRQVQHDNAALLKSQLERIERIDRELVSLRGALTQPHQPGLSLPPSPPSFPEITPLRIETTPSESNDPHASATWLLDRISQLEGANRSAWKDLLGWLSPLPRRSP